VSALLLVALAGITGAAREPAPGGALLVRGAKLLAPDGDSWVEGRVLVVEDGRIAAIVEPGDARASDPDLPRLEVPGAWVVPGLIDLHTHLLLHPYDETPWDEQVLKESLELRTIRAVDAARRTLEAGFTTVRDLGTEGAGYADVALRDAIAAGLAVGPRVYASTRAIVATGCYGPAGFDPRWDVPQGAQEATGPDEVRRVVREQIAAGADWIKVYADYRRAPGAPATPTFTVEELRAAVGEAASAGLPVVAHASTEAGILRAVEAGVRTVEHGSGATRRALEAMRERGVVLCPTLAAVEAIVRYGGWAEGAPEPVRLAGAKASFRLALEVGVTIACGSDAGVFAHGRNARELELLVAWGMRPADALRAATAAAADVLGLDAGRIRPGLRADLVVLAADPLADVAALSAPVCVVQDGRVVGDRRAAAAPADR